jgi:MoCo/4Fe-4S cofactor protein with predicted Tat translocation signal
MNFPSPQLWRGLDERGAPLAGRSDEFPPGAASWDDGLSRRRFLEMLGASLAIGGLSGCMRAPDQEIVSRAIPPEKRIPGVPLHYATTLTVHGAPRGVVVTQTEGRPTHIEGNRLHPLSGGAADIWTIAALLDLYHPDRLATPRRQGSAASFAEFQRDLLAAKAAVARNGGRGLRLLTGTLPSPTAWALLSRFLAAFPQARWHVHDPLEGGPTGVGGEPLAERLDLERADVIFALDADFLSTRPDALRLTRQFSRRRSGESCNRLYVAESALSLTGIRADHRWAVAPAAFVPLAEALRDAIAGRAIDPRWPWLAAVAADLRRHPGRSLLVAGEAVPGAARQALREANRLLENEGRTISSIPLLPPGLRPGTLDALAAEMRSGQVETLLILGGNPAYDAPADLTFADALRKVPLSIHHTLFANETSAACAWSIPAAHDLEAWGDAQSADGTVSLRQPLIAPLYDGLSEIEVLSHLAEPVGQDGHALVRATWRADDDTWRRWLRDGIVNAPAIFPSTPVSDVRFPDAPAPEDGQPWIAFRPDARLRDGQHAENGWLQELPDPVTKLTWGNAALVGPATAERHGLADGDVAEFTSGGATVRLPVLRVPGHAEGGFTLPLGYGRTLAGKVGSQVGGNAYPLRRSDALWTAPLDSVKKTGHQQVLALTQHHAQMEGRDLIRVVQAGAEVPEPPVAPKPSLYPDFPANGHAWGMTIDLGTCIGCNACMVACQSENNIPVVGEEQVLRGREMHWIRVDRYFSGPAENPEAHFQPVPCMHCEKAPCEVVCPVAATQHSDEGLNEMVYNRCVGTRYCSNNCPYKVRRFNFLEYNGHLAESEKLRLNPNVTVRSRGVMEKCTYCVQRIETARIAADRDGRPLGGNDVVTACQSACPAEAIVFGDINDPQSAVSRSRARPGRYALLEELDTRPRTTYLPKRVNPNPELESRA